MVCHVRVYMGFNPIGYQNSLNNNATSKFSSLSVFLLTLKLSINRVHERKILRAKRQRLHVESAKVSQEIRQEIQALPAFQGGRAQAGQVHF